MPPANPGCTFCRLLAGELPASFVHRDELVAAFLDLNQALPPKVLLVPVAHLARLHDLRDEALAGRLLAVAARIARAIERGFGLTDLNLYQNSGPLAGQDVFHLHFHLVGRRPHDGLELRWPTRPADRVELDGLAAELRGVLVGLP